MTGRIGDAVQSSRIASLLQETQARVRTAQTAVATGDAVSRFVEMPATSALLLHARSERAAAAGFVDDNGVTGDRLHAMDSAVGAIGAVAERLRALLVNRLDDSTGGSVPLDAEVDAALETIQGQLNLRLDGRYLFAGSRTDIAPVALPDPVPTTADASLYYQGDAVAPTARIGDGDSLDYGTTAADPAFAGLVGALGQAREAHLAGDRAGLESALAGLGEAVDALAQLRGAMGAQAARLETATEQHRSSILYLEETVSRLVDTDMATALTQIAEDSARLEATYTTVGRLGQLSLADYLR
ncbi:MAG: flagellin [Geminicoccaceae bacterium]